MKILCITCLMLLALSAGAQTAERNNNPQAVVTYNAGKSDQGKLVFDTSFFIFNLQLSEEEKVERTQKVLAADPSFRNLELINANGVKDMMVIVHVETISKEMLTKKIRFLLETLGTVEVSYLDKVVPLAEFSF